MAKFKHVNIDAVRELIPSWACDYMTVARQVDAFLDVYEPFLKCDPQAKLSFWIEAIITDTGIDLSLREPEIKTDDQFLGFFTITDPKWQIRFSVNDILKGCMPQGKYCVYVHTIMTETPLIYIGISSRPWFVRYAEHETAARGGSRLLFHDALRTHTEPSISHFVMLYGVDELHAMNIEEEFVQLGSLYPLGLNMIPGGYAGLRYLSTLSIKMRDTEYAAEGISSVMNRESIDGKPNPLCAARWESDPNYVERVICGHSGRLTVAQVRMIRELSTTCRPVNEIAEFAKAKFSQVKRLLSNQTYSRIK
jgi:hypothetical protein